MRARQGSIVLDKRIRVWNFFWWENGKRRSKKVGNMSQYPTKASAWRAAKPLRDAIENQVGISNATPTVTNSVPRQRRLDVCQPGENRTFANLLRGSVAGAPKSSGQGWHRSHQFPHVPPHPQIMVGCGRYSNRRATEAHAPCGHQNHDERLRDCGNG